MAPRKYPHVDTGTLLLADISGYTSFLEKVAVAHPDMTRPGSEVPPAYAVMSSLLDVVVARISPTFLLAEIEENAVFGYSADDRVEGDGAQLQQIVRSAYSAFRERIDSIRSTCHPRAGRIRLSAWKEEIRTERRDR